LELTVGILKGFSDAGNAWMQAESGGTATPVSTAPPAQPAQQTAAAPPASPPATHDKYSDPTIEPNGYTAGFNRSREREIADGQRAAANRRLQPNVIYASYVPVSHGYGDAPDDDRRARPVHRADLKTYEPPPSTSADQRLEHQPDDGAPAGTEHANDTTHAGHIIFNPTKDSSPPTLKDLSDALKKGGNNGQQTAIEIQKMLIKAGYKLSGANNGADGKFGDSTQVALADYIDKAGGRPELVAVANKIDVSKHNWADQNEALRNGIMKASEDKLFSSLTSPGSMTRNTVPYTRHVRLDA
jgi:hypothetical protein